MHYIYVADVLKIIVMFVFAAAVEIAFFKVQFTYKDIPISSLHYIG